MTDDERQAAMDALYDDYAKIPVLAELAHGKCLVRGYGPLSSPFTVVGEAPGAEEEKRGIPFCGPSGKLLQDLFGQAGIPWNTCYVTNAVCWRPPGNRTPYPFQVSAGSDRLWGEIRVTDAVVVVAAGSVAWRGITRRQLGGFEEARFRWHELEGRRLLAVPHPAFIMRLPEREQPQWKQKTVDALSQALVA